MTLIHSINVASIPRRHARPCPRHPRLKRENKTWMAGTSPAMTEEKTLPFTSHSEISRSDCLARQIFRRAGQRHASFLQTIDAGCGGERLHHVLLDQNDSGAFGAHRR